MNFAEGKEKKKKKNKDNCSALLSEADTLFHFLP